jgi:hypothetical protein
MSLELNVVFKGSEMMVPVDRLGQVKDGIIKTVTSTTEYSGMMLGETATGSAFLEVPHVGPVLEILFEVKRVTWSGNPEVRVW